MACEWHEPDLREAALGSSLSAELEVHLEECASCRAALAEERALLQAIDHGLVAGLGIEPSLGFGARVRRVAENNRARSWLPLAASVAAVAAGVGLLIRGGGRDLPVREPPPLMTPSTTRASGPAWPETGALPPSPRAMSTRAAGGRPGRGGEPQVLVPPGQAVALARFRETLRRGVIPATSLLATEEAEPTSLEPAELDIPPLEVKPLPAPESLPGETENPREGRRPS